MGYEKPGGSPWVLRNISTCVTEMVLILRFEQLASAGQKVIQFFNTGMGRRAWRHALVIHDNVVVHEVEELQKLEKRITLQMIHMNILLLKKFLSILELERNKEIEF